MKWRMFICAICFLIGGCSLNIPLEDQFSDPDAITDVLSARSLLASAYKAMPQQIFQLSVLSDDFCPSQHLNKDMSLQGLYNWREVEMTELAGTLWAGYYAVIAEVNALLARIDAVVTLDETEKLEKMRIVCEAKALKSWCYFDLLRLFAPRYEGNENKDGIILKKRVELDFLPRSSVKECVTEIRTLLNEARNVDNTQKNVYWLSDKAVAYLQVELELYAGNYPAVLELTKDLETEYPESVLGADVYKYLWSSENSDARIFGKYQLEQIYMDIRFDTFEKGDYLVLSQNVDYEEEDIRKEWSEIPFVMPDAKNVRLLGKYNKMNRDKVASKYVNVARAAGMWLMRVEALARSGKEGDAVALANRMLKQRGATEWSTNIAGNELISKILIERQKEYAGEGIRFFDMKRCGLSAIRYGTYGDKVMGIVKADDYRWTLPIPAGEYRYNTSVEQNDGWPKLSV